MVEHGAHHDCLERRPREVKALAEQREEVRECPNSVEDEADEELPCGVGGGGVLDDGEGGGPRASLVEQPHQHLVVLDRLDGGLHHPPAERRDGDQSCHDGCVDERQHRGDDHDRQEDRQAHRDRQHPHRHRHDRHGHGAARRRDCSVPVEDDGPCHPDCFLHLHKHRVALYSDQVQSVADDLELRAERHALARLVLPVGIVAAFSVGYRLLAHRPPRGTP
mmetsp:Transcript_6762/g.13060  ORF Transcript_6762/g.13060 Transcript_6762/m.13060 type:complete len:221 (+) Transcript_6762:486-1148(+)